MINQDQAREEKIKKHVTWCNQGDNKVYQSGRQAEIDTVYSLVDNLNPRIVGDYRILVNYHMPVRGRGATGTVEIDVVLINKFGVFFIEVKDWRGTIEAFDDHWIQNGKYKHGDVFASIQHKSVVAKGNWFGPSSQLNKLGKVSVSGLIVLARGKKYFHNRSRHDDRKVFSLLGSSLINAVSSDAFVFSFNSKELNNQDILNIREAIYRGHESPVEQFIREYRVVSKPKSYTLFDELEGVNVHTNEHVRIKRYILPQFASEDIVRRFKRSVESLYKMGNHTNIVQTKAFFPDNDRPTRIFYEITEYIYGQRLDEIMVQTKRSLSLAEQLDYLEPLCDALLHIHQFEIYHRNITPETIFLTEQGVVKLADFNFAQIKDAAHTVTIPNIDFVESPLTAPEIRMDPSIASPASDIYSVGALWFFLARLPRLDELLNEAEIDEFRFPDSARELMKNMLTPVVLKRPQSMKEVLVQLEQIRNDIGK